METTTDYGDLVESVIRAREAERVTKAAAAQAERDAQKAELESNLRPLLEVMRRTRDKYSRLRLFGCDLGDVRDPHFYVGSNTSIHAKYNKESGDYMLRKSGPIQNSVVATSAHVEDIIPELVVQLATAVEYTYGRSVFSKPEASK